jgi:hypothetical protein
MHVHHPIERAPAGSDGVAPVTIRETVAVARGPREVFDFLANQDNWARMDPALQDLEPRGGVILGRRGTMSRRVLPLVTVTTSWEVTAIEPGARLGMRITGNGYTLEESITTEAGATGTLATFTDTLTPTSGAGRLLVALSGPFIRRDLRARSRRLKALLEGTPVG